MSHATPAPLPAPWPGEFFGHDLSFDQCEVLTIQHIPSPLRRDEAALMQSKWFDYRVMHPIVATYYFAHCYSRAYSDATAIVEDYKKAPYRRGFKGEDWAQTKQKLAFWRTRQLIDKLGIRYDFYLRHAMRWCLENGWHKPPLPEQIRLNEEMVTDVMLRWEEETAAAIPFAKHALYRVPNFRGHPDQIAYEAFILDHVARRQHPKFALNAALYIEQAVRIEEAIRRFPARVIEDAQELTVKS